MSSNNVIQFYVDAPLCLCHFETRVLCESNIYITHFCKREIKVIFLKSHLAWKTACDREDSALASVGCCVRLALPSCRSLEKMLH